MNFFSKLKEEKVIIWLRNLLILLTSLIIFSSGIYFLSYLASLPSIKQKRELQAKEELTEKIKKTVDYLVIDAGWQKRQAGQEILYVPQIRILLSNKSSESLKDLVLKASFEVEGNRLCFDSMPILKLDPGTSSEIVLGCVESLGFGTVFRGLSLIQTAKKVHYEIGLATKNIYFPLTEGYLEFKLISPLK